MAQQQLAEAGIAMGGHGGRTCVGWWPVNELLKNQRADTQALQPAQLGKLSPRLPAWWAAQHHPDLDGTNGGVPAPRALFRSSFRVINKRFSAPHGPCWGPPSAHCGLLGRAVQPRKAPLFAGSIEMKGMKRPAGGGAPILGVLL